MSESTPVVKVRCPACSKKLGFPESSTGKKARCPGCQHTFHVELPPVPIQSPAGAMSPGGPTSETLTVYCPSCSKKLRLPVSASGRKAKCPACEERFTVSAQQPLVERAAPPAQAPDDDAALYDILASAENSAQALAEQPAIPAGFKPRELTPLKPDPDAVAASGPKGKSAKEDKASVMERAYGAMGTLATGCAFSAGGALIGAFIWYGIAKAFKIELGYVAWGVGGLAGLGMHLGVRKESLLAGGLAAVFAFGGIVAGKLMFLAWVFLPQAQADFIKERDSIENQRYVLISEETEKVLKARNINPDDATEEQEESAEKEAETRIKRLSSDEIRTRHQKYMQTHPEDQSDGPDLSSLKQLPTSLMVLLIGLLFGFKGLIFLGLGMVTAFKVGYDGGNFGGES